jgi:hypothetical protein
MLNKKLLFLIFGVMLFITIFLFLNSFRGVIFSTHVVHLGNINEGSKPEWNVVIKNKSFIQITDINVKANCTCTNVLLSKVNLLSGEVALIKGNIDTSKLITGPFRSSIEVSWLSSKKRQKNALIEIDGNLMSVAKIDPQTLDMGIMDKVTEKKLTIKKGDSNVKWDTVSIEAKYLTIKTEKIGDQNFLVTASVNPAHTPIGAFGDTIHLSLLDKNNKSVVKYGIAVVGKTIGDLHSQPPSLYFGVIDSNAQKQIPFSIKSVTKKEIALTSIQTTNDFIKIETVSSEKGKLKFLGTMKPGNKKGNITGYIIIHGKLDRDIELHIPYIAYVK